MWMGLRNAIVLLRPENDVTDQKYTHIVGDDYIPDVFIGRISIDSAYELAVIMLKTIAYAREPLAIRNGWTVLLLLLVTMQILRQFLSLPSGHHIGLGMNF